MKLTWQQNSNKPDNVDNLVAIAQLQSILPL